MSKNNISSKNLTIIMIVVFLGFIAISLYVVWKKREEGMLFPWEEPPSYLQETLPETIGGDHDLTQPSEDIPPGMGIGQIPGGLGHEDPYTPPGYEFIRLDRTTSGHRSITFNFTHRYYATVLTGNLRPGGIIYTNVRIKYKKDGTWRHISTVGGWPEGFINFSTTINDFCEGIKFDAEQGLFTQRFIDEIHGQLMIEVGS